RPRPTPLGNGQPRFILSLLAHSLSVQTTPHRVPIRRLSDCCRATERGPAEDDSAAARSRKGSKYATPCAPLSPANGKLDAGLRCAMPVGANASGRSGHAAGSRRAESPSLGILKSAAATWIGAMP